MPLNPVAHPLAAPTVGDTTISVDTMLQQPTRITRLLMDITLQRFIADRIFTSAGGVTGGAVVYDQATENEIYTTRDVARVAPGGEFPIVTSERRMPKVALVEKWGGKYYFTDEARDRNDVRAFANENQRLANTIIRKLNARAVEVVEAAIDSTGGLSTFAGNDWSAAVPGGSNPTVPSGTPAADFARAQLIGEQRELGISYNVALVNPVQMNELRLFYGQGLTQMLADNGIDEIFSSMRVPAGTAYILAEDEVGEMRIEKPLGTETYRTAENETTWVQASVRPVMYVTNPLAIIKVTGL